MRSNKVFTLTPALSVWIMSSTLIPTCSPARASFSTASANTGCGILSLAHEFRMRQTTRMLSRSQRLRLLSPEIAQEVLQARTTMDRMISTEFFQCEHCHVECRIDCEVSEQDTTPRVIQHCPGGTGITVLGTVSRFQERRGGVWVD